MAVVALCADNSDAEGEGLQLWVNFEEFFEQLREEKELREEFLKRIGSHDGEGNINDDDRSAGFSDSATSTGEDGGSDEDSDDRASDV
eukprot:SAG22_NODE_10818_length_514_cov_1.332530_1_plen_87_part_10